MPKQLLNLNNPEKSLLQESVERSSALVGRDHTFIATGPRVADAIRAANLVDPDNVLVEPSPRNTLPAICFAQAQLISRGFKGDTVVTILTADHAISPTERFQETLEQCIAEADSSGNLVLIGIRPTRPDTGFGYIEASDVRFGVAAFHEKPTLERAAEFLARGNFFWNSGMFVWRLDAFDRELRQASACESAIYGRMATEPEAFTELERVSVDKGLMEKSSRISTIPAAFDWDDLGSWDSLDRTRRSQDGNVTEGDVKAIDSSGCILVSKTDQKIGVIGLEGVVVVATEHGVLVCPKDRVQQVRELL
jgi:mannose-1-phosphate guanylyltransferase